MATIAYAWSANTRVVSLIPKSLEDRYAHKSRHLKVEGAIDAILSRGIDAAVRITARAAFAVSRAVSAIGRSVGITGRRGEYGLSTFFND